MKVNSIILLLIFTLVIFFSFLLLRLNQTEVSLDLLFKEISIRLGLLALSAFVAGLITCLVLESIYFYKRNKN
ncbi:uncharacterized protein METZ01_LOCUS450114 [marine metagenome]|uniref:Lipopolysaccharide assembly protein A domain-containing protein n=1 Tax=marine metagenome TaxID=408172 RepID=A0A382ZPP0_9ZZZZ